MHNMKVRVCFGHLDWLAKIETLGEYSLSLMQSPLNRHNRSIHPEDYSNALPGYWVITSLP